MITAENLTFFYTQDKSKKVLNDINLSVSKGEFVAVLGHNGSGKSTFAKHLNAILLPCGGSVIVGGMDTADNNHIWDIRKTAAMVFQNPDNQIVATVVEEDVAFAAENLGIEPKEIRERVDTALDIVGMSKFKKHAPHLLSGGQKQRIAIAGVIAMRPEIIIFDEPTAMLDPKGRMEVMKCIEDLNKNHSITIILITHNMDEAVRAKRVVVIDDGKIVIDDKPKNIFSKVSLLESLGLDVPQVTKLSYELRKRGIDIAEGILSTDECIREIDKLCP